MPLSQFAEPIESICGSLKAYRMDNTIATGVPDMRSAAGLGTCECCDYVTVSKDNQSVVLIEETDLERTIIGLQEKYYYLQKNHQDKLIYEEVLRENRLKLYGSMLVLCRLSNLQDDVKAFLPENEFQFWLVMTSTASSDSVFMDHLTDMDKLKGFIKGPFSREMMTKVAIFSSTWLAQKLSKEAIQID